MRKSLSKEKSKNDDTLKNLIVNGLNHFEHKKSRKGRLYASSDSLCELKSVYQSNREGISEENFRKEFFTNSGIASEESVLKGLSGSGVLIFDDYRLPSIGINMGGYIDGIIYYKNKIWVMENKEISSLPERPPEYQKSQAMIYSAVTGLPALMCYVERGVTGTYPNNEDLAQKTFELDCSYKNRYKYLVRLVRTDLFNKAKLIPGKPDYMKKTYCSYCELYENCWNGSKIEYDTELAGNWEFATATQTKSIYDEAKKITEQLLHPDIMKNRFKGVMKFLLENSKYDITKKLLENTDWEQYYLG